MVEGGLNILSKLQTVPEFGHSFFLIIKKIVSIKWLFLNILMIVTYLCFMKQFFRFYKNNI